MAAVLLKDFPSDGGHALAGRFPCRGFERGEINIICKQIYTSFPCYCSTGKRGRQHTQEVEG